MTTIRVLVVDDSAFARKVLRQVLQATPTIEVVGSARDGIDALAKIQELDPDVVTLDLIMPNLDGLGTLRALSARERPKVVVVCMADADSELALEALAAGAVDVIHKPTALATERLYELAQELVFKVESAAKARPLPAQAAPAAASSLAKAAYRDSRDVLVIGASTGGPQAIERVLKALPADFPAPIAVVVHLPAGFTQSFAERLNGECALAVLEAYEGVRLKAGQVVIARGGSHLTLARDEAGIYGSLGSEPRSLHRPSLDQLFASAAAVAGRRALGVVLTGMGDDGLAGCRLLREAGAEILVESELTAVVYGMPRVVQEAGLANAQQPLDDIARAILARV
jgi:two-component system chemotaxis response regulator CheB